MEVEEEFDQVMDRIKGIRCYFCESAFYPRKEGQINYLITKPICSDCIEFLKRFNRYGEREQIQIIFRYFELRARHIRDI